MHDAPILAHQRDTQGASDAPSASPPTVEVSLILPAYNEGGRLEATLREACARLAAQHPDFEILIVDDGSIDDSISRVQQWSGRDPRVRIVQLPGHCGKGAAVRAGMLAARGRWLCFCDADLAIPLSEVTAMVQRLASGAYDVVIASRALPGSRVLEPPALMRRWLSWVFNWCVRNWLHLPYRDTQCGCKGFRREAARAIFSHVHTRGFVFDVEVVLWAHRLGYRIGEMPVTVVHSSSTSVRFLRHAVTIAGELWNLRPLAMPRRA